MSSELWGAYEELNFYNAGYTAVLLTVTIIASGQLARKKQNRNGRTSSTDINGMIRRLFVKRGRLLKAAA